MRLDAGLMVAFVALLGAGPCPAQTADYELTYGADAPCPAQQQFEGMVRYYLEGEAPAPGAKAQVTLQESGGRATGSMTLQRTDGTRNTRELSAATCQDVAPALAFVLAYALAGKDSEGDPPNAAGPDTAKAQPGPPPQDGAATAPTPNNASADRPPVRRTASKWRLGLGVALGVRTGLGPIWTPVEVARVEAHREQAGDPFVLAVRASVLRDETVTRIDRNGTTSFEWLAGRLDFCPVRLELLSELGLLPCAGSHVGRILATGEPTPGGGARGRSASELWADAAIAGRVELRLWRVLTLEAQAELLFPLTTYRFAFDKPDTPVYQVPSVASAAFMGLGVHFL
jgi:hypothetical protein